MKRSTFLLTLFSIPFFKYVKKEQTPQDVLEQIIIKYSKYDRWTITTEDMPRDNKWHVVTITKRDNKITKYIDGEIIK